MNGRSYYSNKLLICSDSRKLLQQYFTFNKCARVEDAREGFFVHVRFGAEAAGRLIARARSN